MLQRVRDIPTEVLALPRCNSVYTGTYWRFR